MQPDQFETLKHQPLQMAKEAEFHPKILLNWPPERDYHPLVEKPRTKSKFMICLLLLGLAGYYYLRMHG